MEIYLLFLKKFYALGHNTKTSKKQKRKKLYFAVQNYACAVYAYTQYKRDFVLESTMLHKTVEVVGGRKKQTNNNGEKRQL